MNKIIKNPEFIELKSKVKETEELKIPKKSNNTPRVSRIESTTPTKKVNKKEEIEEQKKPLQYEEPKVLQEVKPLQEIKQNVKESSNEP